jgi:hypothetical protein
VWEQGGFTTARGDLGGHHRGQGETPQGWGGPFPYQGRQARQHHRFHRHRRRRRRPPPPTLTKPLRLTFSLGAPSPLGGADAVAIGSMMLVNGTVPPGGGAEPGLYSSLGSGPWCDFSAELQLPASVATGSVHDVYVSMLAQQRFTLDYLKLTA